MTSNTVFYPRLAVLHDNGPKVVPLKATQGDDKRLYWSFWELASHILLEVGVTKEMFRVKLGVGRGEGPGWRKCVLELAPPLNFSKTKTRIRDESGDDGLQCCMAFSDVVLEVAGSADQHFDDGHDGSIGRSCSGQEENAEDSKLEVDTCGVFLDDAEETFDVDTYAILSRGVGLGSDPHACVAAPSDVYVNADVLESTATGLDDDGDDDLLGQRITLLSQRLSQSHDEMENKQKTADDLKAKVDTPTLASPKRPFAVDIEQEKHTPTTTSKTQKNWMEALAEKKTWTRS